MCNNLDLSLVCMESVLELPSTLSKPKKRWHLAFAAVYCSRALSSLPNHPVNNKKRRKTLPPSPSSFVILNIKPQHGFSNSDQHSLTQIVKQKSLTAWPLFWKQMLKMASMVHKESSDIIILDDNFASAATVLRWGRCVYSSIQKLIQLQLTVNVAALVINVVAAVSAREISFTVLKLL